MNPMQRTPTDKLCTTKGEDRSRVSSKEREDTMSGCYLSDEKVMVILDRLETMFEIFMSHVVQFNADEFQKFTEAKNRIHQIMSDGMREH